jgi:hypothetical protein
MRLEDCRDELQSLLLEERLAGASLLIFANKQDLPGALTAEQIREALSLDRIESHHWSIRGCDSITLVLVCACSLLCCSAITLHWSIRGCASITLVLACTFFFCSPCSS